MTRLRLLLSYPSFRNASSRLSIGLFVAAALLSLPGRLPGQDLGNARLLVAGTRLTVSPESQTVPFDTPTIVETRLEGFDPALGTLPADLEVRADFSGPEVDGVLVLETVPGEPFRIPRLSVKGQYQLDNIRLVQGDELLAFAEPRSAGVLVTQVLVTRVTSRPLTLDEIRTYGIVPDDENFEAFNFTFGFAVDGEVVDYNLPVILDPQGAGKVLRVLADQARLDGGSTGTTSPRFRPPQMAPFALHIEKPETGGLPSGGCLEPEGCQQDAPVSLPGVILFPTDVSLLHQFFSVVLMAKNDAPSGDPLIIRDLTARVVLPPGLRQAETEPPTPLGVPVPVRVPGPDGELGTGDDLTFLVAQSFGEAEVVVEGRNEGTHIVEFQLEGVLEGLPGGQIRRVTGSARGAVVVRDPTLGLTITHPEVVRTDEEYSLLLTVSNTSNAPVNLVTLELPVGGLSGAVVVGESSQTIPTILPGESELVEFRLLSQRTGRVVASSARTGGQVSPQFDLSVGVGELDIPLSPTSIILPRSTDNLPPGLVRGALSLLGLGFSLATAPASLVEADHPRMSLDRVDEKVYWLGQAGRHVGLGEELFDAAAVLAAEWSGARDADWDWDALRRKTDKGGQVGESLAEVFAQEVSPRAAFDRFAETTAFLGPLQAVLGKGSGVRVEVRSRTSGKAVAGSGVDPTRMRELPFADLYDLGTGQMALLAVPEDGGYQVHLRDSDGGLSELHILVPTAAGQLRVVRWAGVSLTPSGLAVADFREADTGFTLFVDADGDGIVDDMPTGVVENLGPRPFTAVAAVQNPIDPAGHMVEILFTQDVDLGSLLPLDPQRFTVPGKVSNGGLIPAEEDIANFFEVVAANPFKGLRNSRIIRVVFNNPISPLVTNTLTIRDLAAVNGDTLAGVSLPIQSAAIDPGILVQGTVYGPDGLPAPFARVDLYEVDLFVFYPIPCRRHRTAAVQADASGRFLFDYVRQTSCTDVYSLEATDPASGQRGTARGRVRFVGETATLDIRMVGRGTVRGRLTYEDGSVPANPQLIAYSPVFFDGREAKIDAQGYYEVGDVPVGTVSVAATDRDGSFVFQTLEIPTAGAVVERDLVIIRRSPDTSTGDVRGNVTEVDGVTPVFNAYLALYIDGELTGVERSDLDGTFDFGTVPTGVAEIEAFDSETGLRGAQVFFEVFPDQVNEVTVLLKDERGTVEGHVYRQGTTGTTAVEGAVVWVSGTPLNTVTDANGFYHLDGVFAGERTVVAVDLEQQAEASERVVVAGDGSVVLRDLYFYEVGVTGGFAGEVLGFSGNPVPGALVHLSTGGNLWFAEAVTDPVGRFVFPNRQPGTYELHAVKGTSGGKAVGTIRFQGETPFVRIQFQKGTIRGTVKALDTSGQPIGVTSLVNYRTTVVQEGLVSLDWVEHTLETAADGTFEIPDVLTGRYVLTVSNAFHGEKTIRGELTYAGEVAEHDVLFESNGQIRGTVLDWDGQTPVAGAVVHLRHPNFAIFDLVTDTEGKFDFGLVPPSVRRFPIDAEIDDGAVFRQGRVWVRYDRFGQLLEVEIVLSQQGTVSGEVRDSNGALVPGAVVTLREHAHPRRTLVVNADAEARFSFTNIFAGKASLSAKAPTLGGLGTKAEVEITTEGEEITTTLTLEDTGEITGQVTDPIDGQPVPGVQVTLYRWGYGIFDSVTADDLGLFDFRLLPLGQYRVWVFDPTTGRHGVLDGVWVEFNNHVRDVAVVLEARGEVDGHLTEPGSGLGVPGATVKLASRALVPLVTYSSTDVDGYFEFFGIPEGTFTLKSREPEGRRQASGAGEITAEDQRVRVDLVLEAAGRVVGTALNPAGVPAGAFANSNVVILQDERIIGATLANPYAFDGVIAGRRFELFATEQGGGHMGLVKGTLPEGTAEITVDVPMRPIGSVAVTVVDGSGNLVPGASVRVENRGFYTQWQFGLVEWYFGTTGADGRAVLPGIGEGTLDVTVTDPVTGLKGTTEGNLTLDGATVELLVQLQNAGEVRGRALLGDGVTPAAEALAVLTTGGRTLQTFVDEAGSFSFGGVPLGPFTLYLQESFGPGTMERRDSLDFNGHVVDLGSLVLDDEDPRLLSLEPASGSLNFPRTGAVTMHFSEPIDGTRSTYGWFTFKKLSGTSVPFSVSWADGGLTAYVVPSSPLASFVGYRVTVNDAVDLAGRHLYLAGQTVFTTEDTASPVVIDVSPATGADQVPVEVVLHLTFSEPVDPASVTGAALQLTDLTAAQGVTTTSQLQEGEREITITPLSPLSTSHNYQLQVQGVLDGSGNPMAAPFTTSFWTVDVTPPEVVSISLPTGTSYVAGAPVAVTVDATDDRGVASVEMRLGQEVVVDTAAPYSATFTAPRVALGSDLPLSVLVTDIFGNTGTSEVTVHVDPRSNATAPAITVGCVRDGGAAVPGVELAVDVTVSDDEAVESWSLALDGVEILRRGLVNLAQTQETSLWTVPVGALPADTFTFHLEAYDYAGNLTTSDVLLTVPAGTVLTAGGDLTAAQAVGDLILTGGVYTAQEPLAPASLLVVRGAEVTAAPEAPDLDLSVTGDLTVQCGAKLQPAAGGGLHLAAQGTLRVEDQVFLDALGKGYAGGTGAHPDGWAPVGVVGASGKESGGSHGGASRKSGSGEVYDSVYFPSFAGGGGALGLYWYLPGGAGGGVVRLEAGTVELDGEVHAGGFEKCEGGAGAGGTVAVQASMLRGSGSIDASGAGVEECGFHIPHAGGGGRVALNVGSLDGFDPATQARAGGGYRPESSGYGATGTVFVHLAGQLYGELLVDQQALAGKDVLATTLPSIGLGEVGLVEVDAVNPADLWVDPADPAELHSQGIQGMWLRVGGADYRILAEGADRRRMLLEGAAGLVQVGDVYDGVYKFDRVTVAGGSKLAAADLLEAGVLDVDPSSVFTPADRTAPAVTVTEPPADRLYTSGDPITVQTTVTDASGVTSVLFRLGEQSFLDTAAPYEWTVTAPVVAVAQPMTIEIESTDTPGNVGLVSHPIQVQPLSGEGAPAVAFLCPTAPPLLAPGTGLGVTVDAAHETGIERVELYVGTDPSPVATDFAAPWELAFTLPVGLADGDVVEVRARARSFAGTVADAVLPATVVTGSVITTDTSVAAGDLTLDGSSVVVAAGTLTLAGPHTFRDLVVLDGAKVTHPSADPTTAEKVDLSLTRDLFVACNGAIDATGKGYPATLGYPEPGNARPFYYQNDFTSLDLSDWQIVDEGTIGGPSNWYVNSSFFLWQATSIRGGGDLELGSYALYSPGAGLVDYRVGFEMRTFNYGSLGLMFRYSDSSNYYRYTWGRSGLSQRLQKMENGVLTTLAELDGSMDYDRFYRIDLIARGSRLEVWVDGVRTLLATDETHPGGTFALYAYNGRADFDDILLSDASAHPGVGGSHGGRGGRFEGGGTIYGNLLDPGDPGAGGGDLTGTAGGGVVRLAAAGRVVVDGTIRANGDSIDQGGPLGAGGSIRLDGASISGAGVIEASGGGGIAGPAAGGGGRIALWGGTIDDGLLARTAAAGGNADTPELAGSAGTVYVRRDGQILGELILDNAGVASTQVTEILWPGSGVIDQVTADGFTDPAADFRHSLAGAEVALNGDLATPWKILDHPHHGQSLTLDVATQPFTGVAGDAWEGLYRFDRLIVRGAAQGVTRSRVLPTPPAEIEAGASWVSEYPPSLSFQEPLAAAQVEAGLTFPVTVTESDLLGVGDVHLEFDGATALDPATPFQWTPLAPRVAVPTSMTLTATTVDFGGHPLSVSQSIEVLPSTDAVSPTVTLGAVPAAGDRVLAGQPVTIDYTLDDDRLLYVSRVYLDGVLQESGSVATVAQVLSSWSWTPLASATPGTVYTVRVEAEDYAGNIGFAERSVQIPEGTVLSGGGNLSPTLDGTIVTLASGTWTAAQPLNLAGLHLLAGTKVVPLAGGVVDLTVSGELRVQAGASIDAVGLGFAAGDVAHPEGFVPNGVTASQPDAGGSHGGAGIPGNSTNGTGEAGEIYDSVVLPRLGGGGGAADGSPGGGGGGVIHLEAASVVLHGDLLARGAQGCQGAGGAGGTIYVQADSLSGAGLIDASGGQEKVSGGCPNIVGAGGGGRVALHVGDLSAFDPVTQVTVWGGGRDVSTAVPYASPGTLFTKATGDLYGRLRVDHGGRGGVVAETLLPSIGKGVVGLVEVDAVNPADLWIEPQDPAKLHDLGTEGMWARIAGVDYPVIGEGTDRRRLLLGGAAGNVAVGEAYVGFYKLDSLTVAGGAALRLTDGHEATQLVVNPGSTFTSFDLTPPVVTITSPAEGAVYSSGASVLITADVSDDRGTVSSVRFQLGEQSFVDTAAPWEWTVPAPVVTVSSTLPIEVEAADPEDNRTLAVRNIQVQPLAPGSTPVVTVTCPTIPGARLAVGTGLEIHADAVSDDGIERLELLLGTDPTVLATDFTAPYQLHLDAPAGAVAGDVLDVRVRARSFTGVEGETAIAIPVVAAQVITADNFLAATDSSLDGADVMVAAGTLTVEGPHTFASLSVLDGASVTHPASTAVTTESLDLALTGDLFLACGGSLDATAKGYPGGFSYPESATGTSTYFTADFSTPDLSEWQVVDYPVGGASNWFVDSTEGILKQTSNIGGCCDGHGTLAYWRSGFTLTDYRMSVRIRSADDDVLGVMFRYQDSGNYYRFLWQRQAPAIRRLHKFENGVKTLLLEDTGVAYTMNQWYVLEVRAEGPRLEIWIDGTRIFSFVDETHPAGTVALYSSANAGSHFDDVVVAELSTYPTAGGSHGGRGGAFDGSGPVYGSLFDPADPGAGGGGSLGTAGGGVVRVVAGGAMVLDGAVLARGGSGGTATPFGAGGSIRLDAPSLLGAGVIDASGGGDGSARPAGGGGRVALYGATIDAGLVDRARAEGGPAATVQTRGAAGTVLARRDAQSAADLILDNHDADHGGVTSSQWTEILAVGSGVIDSVGANSLTDLEADFRHSVVGSEVAVNGDQITTWPVLTHNQHGQSLVLDVAAQPWTALAGDAYEGLYRFDRLVVRGGAQGLTRSPVLPLQTPEVEIGSGWTAGYQPTLTLTSPLAGSQATAEDPITLAAQVDDLLGVREVRFELDGQTFVDDEAPYSWTTTVPVVGVTTPFTVSATAFEYSGLRQVASHDITVVRRPFVPYPDALSSPKNQDLVLAPDLVLANDDSAGGVVSYSTPDIGEILDVPGVGTVYRPPFAFTGVATFTYTAYDVFSPAVTASASVTVTVTGVDEHPVLQPDQAAVQMDNPLVIDVLANDFDPDGGPLQLIGVTSGSAGAQVSFDPAGTVTYTPAPGWQGNDTVVYTAADVSGIQASAELRVEVTAGPPGPVPAILLEDDFSDGDYVGWTITDAGTNYAPSNWWVGSGEVVQSSNIWGNGGTFAAYEAGSAWTDYRVALRLRSSDDDGIGVAFRYQDSGNHYSLYLHRQFSARRLYARVGGVETILAEDSVPYRSNDDYFVEIEVHGPQITVWIDGQQVFSISDTTFAAGTVALESDANANSYFDDVRVSEYVDLPVPTVLLSDDFSDGDFLGWSIVNRPGGTSNWSVVSGEFIQTSNVGETLAIYDGGASWTDVEISLTLASTGYQTLGVNFRFQDSENTYAFLMNYASGVRVLIKKSGGVSTDLVRTTPGYVRFAGYLLQIKVRGPNIEVYLDGLLIMAASDPEFVDGTIALESGANATSYFDNIVVTAAP